MRHQEPERAGIAVGGPISPMFVCLDCERTIADNTVRTDVHHDGIRRRCVVCDDLMTGPYLGSDPELEGGME